MALFLEGANIPYELIAVDTRKGDQHKPEFVAINPNAKTQAIVDGDVRVFDSNAIMSQAVHFKHFAPEPKEYAVDRYDFEAWRHWKIINEHVATRPYMVGGAYSIADMSVWGWARVIPFVLGATAFEQLPHVKRLLDEINARPAAQKAEAIKTQHAFKTEVDEDARKNLFPSNARLKS